jgi:hypothetical protein
MALHYVLGVTWRCTTYQVHKVAVEAAQHGLVSNYEHWFVRPLQLENDALDAVHNVFIRLALRKKRGKNKE